MAKTGFWLQGAKGKFAGAALQKGAFGGTIMRQITTPKNPRSVPQMVQRVCTSTISHAYSALKEICDHSFEGVTYGAQSMAYFRKINSKKLTHRIERHILMQDQLDAIFFFNKKGDKMMVPIQNLQVSEGKLTPILYSVTASYTPHGSSSSTQLPRPSFVLTSPDGNLYKTEDLYQFGKDFNLNTGDQLTFLLLTSKELGSNLNISSNFASSLTTQFVRINFNDEEDALVDEDNNLFGVSGLKATLDTYVEDEETIKKIVGVSYNDEAIVAAAIIVSRKVDGEWKRSTAFMHTLVDLRENNKDDAAWLFNDLDESGRSLYDAIQSYYGESADVPSDYYLNNARA